MFWTRALFLNWKGWLGGKCLGVGGGVSQWRCTIYFSERQKIGFQLKYSSTAYIICISFNRVLQFNFFTFTFHLLHFTFKSSSVFQKSISSFQLSTFLSATFTFIFNIMFMFTFFWTISNSFVLSLSELCQPFFSCTHFHSKQFWNSTCFTFISTFTFRTSSSLWVQLSSTMSTISSSTPPSAQVIQKHRKSCIQVRVLLPVDVFIFSFFHFLFLYFVFHILHSTFLYFICVFHFCQYILNHIIIYF